jgi:hypothetical protein
VVSFRCVLTVLWILFIDSIYNGLHPGYEFSVEVDETFSSQVAVTIANIPVDYKISL